MSDLDHWKETVLLTEKNEEAANIVAHVKAVLTKFLWINRIPPETIKQEMRNAAREVIETMQNIALRLRDEKPHIDARLTPAEIKMLMRPDED